MAKKPGKKASPTPKKQSAKPAPKPAKVAAPKPSKKIATPAPETPAPVPASAPEAPSKEAVASSMKSLGVTDMKTLDTIKSGYGTPYGIIARAKGLSLSIAPKFDVETPVLGVYIRVRIQMEEEWANLSEGPAFFGFPEAVEKSATHMSTEIWTPVGVSPMNGYEFGLRLAGESIIEKIVDSFMERVVSSGVATCVEPALIVGFIKSYMESALPSEPPPPKFEFKGPYVPAVGDGAIRAVKKSLFEAGKAYYASFKKSGEAPAPSNDIPMDDDGSVDNEVDGALDGEGDDNDGGNSPA